MDPYAEAPQQKEEKVRLPKAAQKVKNKMPAPVQITAEQLIREAKERELELTAQAPELKINDAAELEAFRHKKRKEFEDNIRKNRNNMSNWLKYARWEEIQKEVQRARSVYERCLDIEYRNITVWLRYAEMEMRNKQVNHSRNLWDRAVTILPRANQLWYKWSYMEELLGNVAGARQVFERWMLWEPDEQAWHTYVNFELRYKEIDRARAIYEKFVLVHPEPKNWVRFAKFEERHGFVNSARHVFERAVDFFGRDHIDEHLLIAFAAFEERQKEHDRARAIYKYGLDHLPKEKCQQIYNQFTIHEKKFGDRLAIEDVIVSKRRYQYEDEVKKNPHNYDTWFDYVRLLESDGTIDQIRETYERAIACIPPAPEKRFWRRYVYLWINYALFEELVAKDVRRTRQVYSTAIYKVLSHKKFTFAKLWLLFAHFELRQKDVEKARQHLDKALEKCPKDKLFRGYIEMELQLREFDRCRKLYTNFVLFNPANCSTWIQYAELENSLGETGRARALFEVAIEQPRLDMPELLWKAYIDFETENEEWERARQLFRRLLERTQHVKVWTSFAHFELGVPSDQPNPIDAEQEVLERSRAVYREADGSLKRLMAEAETDAGGQAKEHRVMLLEAWLNFEKEHGTADQIEEVEKLQPKRIKRRRRITLSDGSEGGWEEFYDYIFPDEEAQSTSLLELLDKAKMWKAGKLSATAETGPAGSDRPVKAADQPSTSARPPSTSPASTKTPSRHSSDSEDDDDDRQMEVADEQRRRHDSNPDRDSPVRHHDGSSSPSSSSSSSSSEEDDDDDQQKSDEKHKK